MIFDAVGKLSFARCRRSLRPGGSYLATDGLRNLPLALVTAHSGTRKVKFSIPPRYTQADVLLLKQLLEAGSYRAIVDRTYPLRGRGRGHPLRRNRAEDRQRCARRHAGHAALGFVWKCRLGFGPFVTSIERAALAPEVGSDDMAKYLVLIYGNEQTWADAPAAWQDANAAKHQAFIDSARPSILGVSELAPAARAVSVRRGRSGKPSVTDGPFLESKEVIGGYYLLDAPDLTEAIRLASQIPEATDTHGGVEIRAIVDPDAARTCLGHEHRRSTTSCAKRPDG